MKEELGTVEYASMLYDFYGDLLSESQSEVMSMYHEDNLSLSEIAEELGMSRQAVHYTLKKAEKALNGYEAKLGLLKSYEADRKLAEEAADIIDRCRAGGADNGNNAADLTRLEEIIRSLVE